MTFDPLDLSSLDHALLELVRDPGLLTHVSLWRCLTKTERRQGIREVIIQHDRSNVGEIRIRVAAARHLRPKTVASWTDQKLAEAAAVTDFTKPDLLHEFIFNLHVKHRSAILGAFLDELRIPHENGQAGELKNDSHSVPDVLGAARTIAGTHEIREVVVYFLALVLFGMFKDGVLAWFEEVAASSPPEADAPVRERPPHERVGGTERPVEKQPTFSTLDTLIVRAIVDCAQDVDGGLTEDAVDDLVEETVQLNSSRHQSYFHLGFRDAVLDRVSGEQLPAESMSRARWYWAGAIQGWARRESWGRILSEFDGRPVVRRLGDGGDAASTAAAPFLVEALHQGSRSAEIASFLSESGFELRSEIFRQLLDIGTTLLRTDFAAHAKPLFSLLTKTARQSVSEGYASKNDALLMEARRRHAHCLRQLGEHHDAKKMLFGLLECNLNPELKAMVLADLGLLAASFRMLSEVQLPSDEAGLDPFLEALAEGVECFKQSAEISAAFSAHGRYCLGVLALGEREFDTAAPLLRDARARFRAEPHRYSTELVSTCDLYFGISEAQALSADRLAHASRIMIEALDEGTFFPPYLLATTIDALTVTANEHLSAFCAALLKAGNDIHLDALLENCDATACTPVAGALLARSQLKGRSATARAQDLRTALTGFMRNGDHEASEEILDELESMAFQSVGTEAFAQLLDDPTAFDPAWSPEDAIVARAHCLETLGELTEASSLLQQLFHQLASQGTIASLGAADGLLERIEGYGLPAEHHSALISRRDALREQEVDDFVFDGDHDNRRILKVLVVGGDERQAKNEAWIEERLVSEALPINVTFIQTGWSGHWNGYLADVQRALPSHHGLVIMRFIRTGLGRQVRKACEVPWRFCWGGGRELILRTICEAANAAQHSVN